MAPVYNQVLFSKQDLGFPTIWVKEPRHSETILADMCYLYRRTRHKRGENLYNSTNSSHLSAAAEVRLRHSSGTSAVRKRLPHSDGPGPAFAVSCGSVVSLSFIFSDPPED